MESVGSDQDGGAPSKVSDSGVGGLESEEENWISDTEVSKTKLINLFILLSDYVYVFICLSVIESASQSTKGRAIKA